MESSSIVVSFDKKRFETLDIPIPENVYRYSEEIQENIYSYLSQLNPTQKKAYLIAKNHLGTSFHILRSTGYVEWLKTKK